jgi:catechol 2,3-dioxygenase-like lactoylglutathione lyase family enzyme
MSTTEIHTDPTGARTAVDIELRLEVVVIPVSDVDRAKAFYAGLGWRLDADVADEHGFRIVQFTPPGSPASIQFGSKVTSAPVG